MEMQLWCRGHHKTEAVLQVLGQQNEQKQPKENE